MMNAWILAVEATRVTGRVPTVWWIAGIVLALIILATTLALFRRSGDEPESSDEGPATELMALLEHPRSFTDTDTEFKALLARERETLFESPTVDSEESTRSG